MRKLFCNFDVNYGHEKCTVSIRFTVNIYPKYLCLKIHSYYNFFQYINSYIDNIHSYSYSGINFI